MPIRNAYGFKAGLGLAKPSGLTFKSAMSLSAVPPLLKKVDLTKWMPECYDQMQTSSCVLNAWAAAIQYGQTRSNIATWTPSRLFAYWNARVIEGDTNIDGGSYIHDAFHQARFVGIIPESDWPFKEENVCIEPEQKLFEEAKADHIHFFASVNTNDLNEAKLCLAHGFPFVFGFQVPAIFEQQSFSDNPQLHLPANNNFVGGHGVCAVGYDDERQQFLIRNSWGSDWGENGYFWMDYDFMTSEELVSDAWMVRFLNQETTIL